MFFPNLFQTDKASKEPPSSTSAMPSKPPMEASQDKWPSSPFGGKRRYFYRMLGYQPKMLRMRAAHLFLWYLVYGGQTRKVLKKEALADVEKMTGAELELLAKPVDKEAKSTAEKGQDGDCEIEIVGGVSAEEGASVQEGASVPEGASVHEEASVPAIPISIRKIDEKSAEDEVIELLEKESSMGSTGNNSPVDELQDISLDSSRTADQSEASSCIQTNQLETLKDTDSQSENLKDTDGQSETTITLDDNVEYLDVEKRFQVYCDSNNWRRYVPPLPPNAKRPYGWCSMRDCLLAMPLSVYVKIVHVPVEVS